MLRVYKIFFKSQLILFVAFLLVSIFIFSEEMTKGFKQGVFLCFNILVPSLFPFMTLSSFIIHSGILKKLDKICSPITKTLFNLPGCTAKTILLGLVGGYPTGASGITTLLKDKQISHSQAQQMILFLVSAGPSFVISAVGTKLLHNVNLGIVIFLSQTLATIFLGIIVRFFFKSEPINNKSLKGYSTSLDFSEAFVVSVKDSSQNIFNMCAFVVLFSSFMEIIKNNMVKNCLTFFKINSNLLLSIITSIFEITSGCNSLCNSNSSIGLIVFFLSFGGLCVHLQIFSIIENLKLSKIKFISFRLLHGLISAVTFYILLSFSNQSVQTFNTVGNQSITYDFTTSGIEILFLCLCFLNTLTSEKIDFKKE